MSLLQNKNQTVSPNSIYIEYVVDVVAESVVNSQYERGKIVL